MDAATLFLVVAGERRTVVRQKFLAPFGGGSSSQAAHGDRFCPRVGKKIGVYALKGPVAHNKAAPRGAARFQ